MQLIFSYYSQEALDSNQSPADVASESGLIVPDWLGNELTLTEGQPVPFDCVVIPLRKTLYSSQITVRIERIPENFTTDTV